MPSNCEKNVIFLKPKIKTSSQGPYTHITPM